MPNLEQTVSKILLTKIKEETYTYLNYGNSTRKDHIKTFENIKSMNIIDPAKIDTIIRELENHNVMNYDYKTLDSHYNEGYIKIRSMIIELTKLIDKNVHQDKIDNMMSVCSDLSNEVFRMDYSNARYSNIWCTVLFSTDLKSIFKKMINYNDLESDDYLCTPFIKQCNDMIYRIENFELQYCDWTEIHRFHEIYKPLYDFLETYVYPEKYYASRKNQTIKFWKTIKEEYLSIALCYDNLLKCVLSEEEIQSFTCMEVQ